MASSLDKQVGGNHYKEFKIQPIEYIHQNQINYNLGNVIKYLLRNKSNREEDIKKAIHYLELEVDLQEAKEKDLISPKDFCEANNLDLHTEVAIIAIDKYQSNPHPEILKIIIQYLKKIYATE